MLKEKNQQFLNKTDKAPTQATQRKKGRREKLPIEEINDHYY